MDNDRYFHPGLLAMDILGGDVSKYDGWAMKNRYGSILQWTFRELKREVILLIGGLEIYHEEWIGESHKIVKVKLVEVDDA